MRLVAAGVASVSVFLILFKAPMASLVERVGAYLAPADRGSSTYEEDLDRPPLASAGVLWTPSEVAVRRAGVAAAGAVVGLLLAQGDLFLAGSTRSAPALAILGALCGLLGFRIWVTRRIGSRSRQLRAELPVVADLVALRVLAGESVASALEHVAERTSGVAAEEFREVLARYREGKGLPEALQAGVHTTVADEAKRLYGYLANAHQSGGRLAEALLALSEDYRAAEERALHIEGGKRAIAVYAPILALMIPVTLMFLMYPTLAGLSELSAVPS